MLLRAWLPGSQITGTNSDRPWFSILNGLGKMDEESDEVGVRSGEMLMRTRS